MWLGWRERHSRHLRDTMRKDPQTPWRRWYYCSWTFVSLPGKTPWTTSLTLWLALAMNHFPAGHLPCTFPSPLLNNPTIVPSFCAPECSRDRQRLSHLAEDMCIVSKKSLVVFTAERWEVCVSKAPILTDPFPGNMPLPHGTFMGSILLTG